MSAEAKISGGAFFCLRTAEDLIEATNIPKAPEPTEGEGLSTVVLRPLRLWPAAFAALLCGAIA